MRNDVRMHTHECMGNDIVVHFDVIISI